MHVHVLVVLVVHLRGVWTDAASERDWIVGWNVRVRMSWRADRPRARVPGRARPVAVRARDVHVSADADSWTPTDSTLIIESTPDRLSIR